MHIHQATLANCHEAEELGVVIDVIRAFTVAPFAAAAGASRIIPVLTLVEAFALRPRFPGALLMGEVGGLLPEGFDLDNSPQL